MRIIFQAYKLKKKMHPSPNLSDKATCWGNNPSSHLLCILFCPILPIFLVHKTLKIYQGELTCRRCAEANIFISYSETQEDSVLKSPSEHGETQHYGHGQAGSRCELPVNKVLTKYCLQNIGNHHVLPPRAKLALESLTHQ